ncbi:MAG: sigma 54-interacting transcriptional regulator [Deltaproteobacteria bacterium]|nr:sigma 54-interacting transcriptional regulator [Deltaproteobacteria bacterium]
MVAPSLVIRLDPGVVVAVARAHDGERTVTLEPNRRVVLGNDEGAGLRVDDPTVSRNHASLTLENGEIHVVDLGSTNGTWYEGARITDALVPVGSTVQLGHTRVLLRPREAELHSRQGRRTFGDLVGEDTRMTEMFALLADVAAVDATVIVTGETGTGKELVAHALHDASPRARKPFVVFDCTATPRDLVESALFGHVKGAFTGATAARDGVFRRAQGGTVFLDEIGELPLDLQPKLLRVLESRTVQPVGGDEPQKVDVRVVCATHRDLKAEVRAGRFREDLYFRLAVVKAHMPALRERPADIPVLARHFATSFAEQSSRPLARLDEDGLTRLVDYRFPGNVRELRNLVERSLSLAKGGMVDLSAHLPKGESTLVTAPKPTSRSAPPESAQGRIEAARLSLVEALAEPHSYKDAKALVVDAFERAFLEGLLAKAGQSLSRAAQQAQMDRKHLRELLRKHGLRSEAPGDDAG